MTSTVACSSRVEADARPAFVEGAKALAPMAVSVAPFGLAIGAAASAAQIPAVAGWLAAPLILAGAAQLTAIEMLDAGAAPLVIIVSALVLNARIVMYSAAMAPWFRDEPLRRRLLLAVPLIDQMYLVSAPRFEQGGLDNRGRRAFWVGGAVVLVGTWVTMHTIGMVAGSGLPDAAGLHVAAPLALAALLAKSVNGRPAAVASVVAGGAAVVGAGLPYQSAVLVAALVGIAAALFVHEPTTEEVTS